MIVFAAIMLITIINQIKEWYESRFDIRGFKENGIHRNGTKYDDDGFDCFGYDRNGYDRNGYNKEEYDKDGYHKSGYNRDGYDKDGYHKSGFNKDGYNRKGYDKDGYNKDGYDKEGYDKNGYNQSGYNKEGYHRETKDTYGFCYEDYYNQEFDEYGFNKAGIYFKIGYSSTRGDKDIKNFHKYAPYSKIEIYSDYILVSFFSYLTESMDNAMLRYGWKYYPQQRTWVNKTNDVDLSRFINFVKHNAKNQTCMFLKSYNNNYLESNDTRKYDLLGYDKDGYDRSGYNREGVNREGYNKNGFNQDGFNVRGENEVDAVCELIKKALLSPSYTEYLNPVTTSSFFSYKTGEPEVGGVFCENIFGNMDEIKKQKHHGIKARSQNLLTYIERLDLNKMGAIYLNCTVVNPWFFSALSMISGLSDTAFSDVVYHKRYLVLDPGSTKLEKYTVVSRETFRETQVWYDCDIRTGAEAIYELVKNIDLNQKLCELAKTKSELLSKDRRKSLSSVVSERVINRIDNKIKIIKALSDSRKRPEWMFIDNLPVIPLDLRPYEMYDNSQFSYHSVNSLYRNVIRKNEFIARKWQQGLPEAWLEGAYVELQEAIDALFDNENCEKPIIDDYTKCANVSLKNIFFNENGLFLDLLNGCEKQCQE